MDRSAEIEQIRHELEMLRARYAIYERWGRVLRVFFMIWFPLFAIVVAALFVKLFIFDAFMGAFFVGLVLVLALMVWLARGRSSKRPDRDGRWISLASLSPSVFRFSLSSDVAAPYVGEARRPDAQVVKEQIAARERRLAELGASS